MLKAYLKIIFALFAILCVALGVAVLFYFWDTYIEPSRRARQEIALIQETTPESIDLGKGEYDAAISFLQQGDQAMARQRLANVMTLYKDSNYYSEAKRIIGEQNVDALLSRDPMAGKVDYVVKRGDSLLKIEAQSKSTLQYITYVNNLTSINLNIGDQLIICPFDFTILVDTTQKTLEIRQDDKFFKEYPVKGFKFPPNTPSSFDATIKGKEAYKDGNSIRFDKPEYLTAQKIIRTSRAGVNIRQPPTKNEDKEYTTGIFLDAADVEELNIFLRNGSNVFVRR